MRHMLVNVATSTLIQDNYSSIERLDRETALSGTNKQP